MSRKSARFWIICSSVLAAALFLPALSAGFPQYSAVIRRLALYASAGLSAVFSLLPFAMSEVVILLLLPALAALFIINMRKYGAKKGAKRAGKALFCVLCVAALLFSLNLGVHYGAPKLPESVGLYVGRYTAAQLAELCDTLLERANHYAELAPRDGTQQCDFGSFKSQAGSVMSAYGALSRSTQTGFNFSVFDTPRAAPPKSAPILSVAMSYLGISGYYFPWTAEEIVSIDTLDMTLPFTIAHEAAHGFGVAAEDEANFAAFLACSRSADNRLAYSAYFNVYIYASNALYSYDYDAWAANVAQRSERLTHDLISWSEHLARYETPVRDIGEAVNDGYIKATGQPDGVRTYGRVVDLLLAWHFADDVFGGDVQ